jgi:GNAT superfamily N-acetyltransferase
MKDITYKINEIPDPDAIMLLYEDASWGHKNFPDMLLKAYENSDFIISAYSQSDELIALGRAITDKAFTVYFPDLLVKKSWQNKGIGQHMMMQMLEEFKGFHNQVLIAESVQAISFYEKCGFVKETHAMSISEPFQ